MSTGLKSFEQFDSGVSLIKVDLKCCFGHWLAQNLLDVWKDGMVTLLSNGWVPSRVVRHWQGQEGWRAPLSCLSSTALLQIACLQPPPRFTIITSLLSRVATERDLIKVHLGGATQEPIQSKHWISILQKMIRVATLQKIIRIATFQKKIRFATLQKMIRIATFQKFWGLILLLSVPKVPISTWCQHWWWWYDMKVLFQ